jgi:two-component system, NtrC family, sensor kinase
MSSLPIDGGVVVDSAPVCVIVTDDQGRIVEFNRAAETTFGRRRESAIGRDADALVSAAGYRGVLRDFLGRYRQSRDATLLARPLACVAARADGEEFPAEIEVSVVEAADATWLIACLRDTSLRDDEQHRWNPHDAETQVLLASIPSVLIHIDPAGTITRWNTPAETVFGISADDAIGRPCRSLPWGDPEIAARLESLAHTCQSDEFSNVIVKPAGGDNRIIDLTVNSICSDGQCAGVLVLGSDRTNQSQLESGLRQAQKLESIGQLASGIAHEINTPMQFVKDNIEFLSDSLDALFKLLAVYDRNLTDGGPERPWLERVAEIRAQLEAARYEEMCQEIPQAIFESLEGIHRVIDIVKAMKDFTRLGNNDKEDVDLNAAVQSSITITRNRWKNAAEMELDLDPYLPPIYCVQAELSQVLLNLIVNAADAIVDQTETTPGQMGTITVRTRYQPGFATLEVADTGSGIPAAVRSRIFDPFFTTKEVGKGTGQGLTICYNIVVQKLEGTIDVESDVGKGTTFKITIPIQPRETDATTADQDTPDSSDEDESYATSIPIFAD